jgi:uncharacterized OsmC-like protein
MSATTTINIVNGYNVTALEELSAALKQHSDAGRVTFKSTSKWQDGARVLTYYNGYTVDGETLHAQRRFVLLSDEPTELTGTDIAPGPVEQLLHALGGCVAATINANAAFMGVALSHLEVSLESDLDLHGYFGLDDNIRPGVQALRMRIRISGEADEETLKVIAQKGYHFSPVRDSVNNGVDVIPEIIIDD